MVTDFDERFGDDRPIARRWHEHQSIAARFRFGIGQHEPEVGRRIRRRSNTLLETPKALHNEAQGTSAASTLGNRTLMDLSRVGR